MSESRPPSRTHSHARAAAHVTRRRLRSSTLSARTRIARALARHAADDVTAVTDAIAPFMLCSERELFERIFGFAP